MMLTQDRGDPIGLLRMGKCAKDYDAHQRRTEESWKEPPDLGESLYMPDQQQHQAYK